MQHAKHGRARPARLLLAIGLLTMLAGCNTISGIGRDLESVGDTVSDTAERSK